MFWEYEMWNYNDFAIYSIEKIQRWISCQTLRVLPDRIKFVTGFVHISLYEVVYRDALFFITVVLAISLIQFSPIENNKRKLDLLEKKRYKKIIVISVTVFLITALILLWLNKDRYAICIFIGIQLTASLQIPCLFLKMKKDQKEP